MSLWKCKFIADDSGAITVDWVVLCAGLVGLAILATTQIRDSTDSLSASVFDSLPE